jgi:hypothetical protein
MSFSMKRIKKIANEDIRRLLVGIPEGHQHLRALLETEKGERFLFCEATLANLVRAYINIKTHPQKRALELLRQTPQARKKGYAPDQLLETDLEDEVLCRELEAYLKKF